MSLFGRQCRKIPAVLWQIRNISCWSCGSKVQKPVANLFCPSCNSLQRPESDNYFKIIGVNETYDQDPSVLAKKYKNLQKYLHPDKFANKPQSEQEISETYSSLVNEAYNTLLDPLSRGIYMARLKGQNIPESTQMDSKFLMEIMEINEQVEEAETEEEIMELNKKNQEKINELQKKLSKAFFDGDMKLVMELLSHLKYYSSIDTQIQASIRSKGIIR